MPKSSRVHRCVEHLKGHMKGNVYAICQAATKQSYATGKSLKDKKKR